MEPVLVLVAGFAFLAVLLAWSRWLVGRRWAAAGHLLLAAFASAVVVGGWPFAEYLRTYTARAANQPVAELFFERVGPDRFRVALTRLPEGRMQVVEMAGDQWRLDVGTLDWSEHAARLGIAPRYRIERIASRTGTPATSGIPRGVTHELAPGNATLPRLAGVGAGHGTPLVSTGELTGPWLPMADGARFGVRLAEGQRLEVNPLNPGAAEALPRP